MPTLGSTFKRLIALAGCVAALGTAGTAGAQTAHPRIAPDLAALIGTSTAPGVAWATSINGQLYAKVLVVASGSDVSLTPLRQAILAHGG